mmetsp:Transcript_12339/g.29933  ORF Transcript_12339/g.29933 Transcript_12339/m.29933 type:complete len:207 (+) Transcript_12339:294-914(+)
MDFSIKLETAVRELRSASSFSVQSIAVLELRMPLPVPPPLSVWAEDSSSGNKQPSFFSACSTNSCVSLTICPSIASCLGMAFVAKVSWISHSVASTPMACVFGGSARISFVFITGFRVCWCCPRNWSAAFLLATSSSSYFLFFADTAPCSSVSSSATHKDGTENSVSVSVSVKYFSHTSSRFSWPSRDLNFPRPLVSLRSSLGSPW